MVSECVVTHFPIASSANATPPSSVGGSRRGSPTGADGEWSEDPVAVLHFDSAYVGSDTCGYDPDSTGQAAERTLIGNTNVSDP